MSRHACHCGHLPADHEDGTGECLRNLAEYAGDVNWAVRCGCLRYEWAGDE